MGFILNIVAFLLFPILSVLNIVVVVWKNPKWKTFTDYFLQSAVDIDVFGNHNLRTLLNTILRKRNGYNFGKNEETISSALGKNKRDKTLSIVGILICKILDTLDKNHSIKSINKKV
jgi:hypothetical protein